MTNTNTFSTDAWYPIEVTSQIQEGAITQAFLLGQELAIWRNRAGQVLVWENRCPHRSVRLTLGRIVNDQLACGYHGWRYGHDGACTYIPAHPSAQPPRNACIKSFPVVEQGGMIWTSLGNPHGEPNAVGGTFCRSYVRNCDIAEATAKAETAGFKQVSAGVMRANALDGLEARTLLFAPTQTRQCVFHLWVDGVPSNASLHAENLRAKELLDFSSPTESPA